MMEFATVGGPARLVSVAAASVAIVRPVRPCAGRQRALDVPVCACCYMRANRGAQIDFYVVVYVPMCVACAHLLRQTLGYM